jgi:AraC-like DNA-binding protein
MQTAVAVDVDWRIAIDLLRSTDRKLVDIAQSVGFANQSHFAAVFRQRCQMTPMAYRVLTRSSG